MWPRIHGDRGTLHSVVHAKRDSSSSESSSSEPPRITSNSLIPVRRQIQWVRRRDEEVRKTAFRAPRKERTKEAYRKETPTLEERQEQRRLKEAEEMELSKAESKNVALSSLYGTNPVAGMNKRRLALRATRSVPILLVDGYNCLFKWSLTTDLMADGMLEEARDVLVSHLEDYSRFNGIRVVVAFDAMGNMNSTGTTETLLPSGLTTVFCGDREADTFISAHAREWINRGAKTVVVVTDDVVLRVATQSTDGHKTVTVPVSGLISDMTATRKRAQAGMSTGAPVLNLLECAVKEKDTERGNDTLDKLQALRNSLLPSQPVRARKQA